MQMSILQSRLVASLAASLVVLALYLLLCSPKLALAAELDFGIPSLSDMLPDLDGNGEHQLQISYEPDFPLADRGIIGRQAADINQLDNNGPLSLNLEPGGVACYVIRKSIFPSNSTAAAQLARRERLLARQQSYNPNNPDDDNGWGSDDDSIDHDPDFVDYTATALYIAANTCMQPTVTGGNTPQLSLYVSSSSNPVCPGPTSGLGSNQTSFAFDQGGLMQTINSTGDMYVSVVAPNITANHTGQWNFQIAASIEEYYYQYNRTSEAPELLWFDSDSSSVLLLTKNLTLNSSETESLLNGPLAFDLFVQSSEMTAMSGLENSVCGMQQNAPIEGLTTGDGRLNDLVSASITTSGVGGFPKQQFYLSGLNKSTTYVGVLTVPSRDSPNVVNSQRSAGTAGGGGTSFGPTTFSTTATTNCRVIADLSFCTNVLYSVPGNDNKFNGTTLAQTYDNYAKEMYSNFQKSMMQFPCDADSRSAYSLVRTCDDCASAYKQWLCTVAFPRCEDVTSTNPFAVPRNMGAKFPNGTTLPGADTSSLTQYPYFNSSRNSWIDTVIQPGPYKEVLPCADLCYQVVQSCPAAMGLTCPRKGRDAFTYSYGEHASNSSEVSCNYPGEALTPIAAAGLLTPSLRILFLAVTFAGLSLFG